MTGHCITWRLWLLWWNWIHSLSDELHLTAVPRNATHSKDSPCIFVGFFDYSAILLISTAKVISSHSEKVHKLIFLSWYVSCAFGVSRAVLGSYIILSSPDSSNLHFLPSELKRGRKLIPLVAAGCSTWIVWLGSMPEMALLRQVISRWAYCHESTDNLKEQNTYKLNEICKGRAE